ncbi:MAG: hypothetical protein ACLFQX_00590 [Candidatus Kapaibacterium sp.]
MKLSFLFILIFCTTAALSQNRQTPFDSAGRFMALDARAAAYFGLFKNYDDLEYAKIFQLPDSTYAVEIDIIFPISISIASSRFQMNISFHPEFSRQYGPLL